MSTPDETFRATMRSQTPEGAPTTVIVTRQGLGHAGRAWLPSTARSRPRSCPLMLSREAPTLFVVVEDTPSGELAVPAASARVAAQAARHLTEYCPHTQATWQVNPHAGPGPVVVFGCARPPADRSPAGSSRT